MEEEQRKWTLKDLPRSAAGILLAIFRGKFIQKLHMDRVFPQIIFTFALFALVILFSLLVDSTLVKVEVNNKTIQDLEVLHTQKSYELQGLYRQSTVSRMLKDAGSKVGSPLKPAVELD